MQEITVYKVGLTGTVEVQAGTAEEARTKALAHFAQAPMLYLQVLEVNQVLTDEAPSP